MNVIEQDAKIIENILDNCEIVFSERDVFFGHIKCNNRMETVIEERKRSYYTDKSLEQYDPAMDVRAYDAYYDFGHTAPYWDDIVNLGVPGLKKFSELSPSAQEEFINRA